MTRTPTTLQPFTNLLLAELKRLDLIDKNKEVARRCNEALGKAGYILGPQLYRVGGAVPEDGWSRERKKRAIAVTSRTVTRWKQGVIPVGAHIEAVDVALFEEGISEAAFDAMIAQEAFQALLKFGVREEEIQHITFDAGVEFIKRNSDVISIRGLPIYNFLDAVATALHPHKLNLGVEVRPATPARAVLIVEEVEAAYARAGKTPPVEMASWIRRLMALMWCGRHRTHIEYADVYLFFTDEMTRFIRENQ